MVKSDCRGSIKKVMFVKEKIGIDGNKKINGRKRHIIFDSLVPYYFRISSYWKLIIGWLDSMIDWQSVD